MSQKKPTTHPLLKWLRYASIGSFIIIFIFILNVGYKAKYDMEHLISDGVKTQATITELNIENQNAQASKNQPAYLISYIYKDHDGLNHQSSRYCNKAYFEHVQIGQKLDVYYQTQHAKIHELSSVLSNRITNLSSLNIVLRSTGLGMFGVLFFELLRMIVIIMFKKKKLNANQSVF